MALTKQSLFQNPFYSAEMVYLFPQTWKKKKNFVAPFYRWGSTVSKLEPLWGGNLLFTIKFLKISGIHLSTSEGWEAESTLEPPSGFDYKTPGLGTQRLNHSAIVTKNTSKL